MCVGFMIVGLMSVGFMSVGLMKVGLMNVGLMSVGLMKQHLIITFTNITTRRDDMTDLVDLSASNITHFYECFHDYFRLSKG